MRRRSPRAAGSSAASGITRPGPSKALPIRQLIDAVTPDNPVFVQRLDGHMGLANALAMGSAGITSRHAIA